MEPPPRCRDGTLWACLWRCPFRWWRKYFGPAVRVGKAPTYIFRKNSSRVSPSAKLVSDLVERIFDGMPFAALPSAVVLKSFLARRKNKIRASKKLFFLVKPVPLRQGGLHACMWHKTTSSRLGALDRYPFDKRGARAQYLKSRYVCMSCT